MQRDRAELLLREPNLYKAILVLALPVFGANFMKAFNELVDTFFIGQIADSVLAQAAVSMTWPVLNLFAAFQVGFGVAGVALVSHMLGAGERERARENAGVLLVVSVLFGALLNLLLWLLSPPVLALMGIHGQTLELAVLYLRVRSCELIFTGIFTAFLAVRQAQGDTVTPVALSVTSVVLNIVLTALCVQGLGLGVFGAALATVLGNAAVAPVCLVLMFSPRQPLFLAPRHLHLHLPVFLRMTRVATPAAFSQMLGSLGYVIIQMVILSYGEAVTAAFSIGNKVSNILLMPMIALGSVLAAYVGQNLGAGNGPRARRAYLACRNMGLAITIAGCVLLFPLRGGLVRLLSNDPATQAAAFAYLFWVLLMQPFLSLFQNYLGAFNGSGHTGYSFLITTLRLWAIRLPLILLFRTLTDAGESGVWYAMTISNFIILLIGALLFRRIDFSAGEREPAEAEEADVL